MRSMIPAYVAARPDLKHVPLIDTPSIDNLRTMWTTKNSRTKFIDGAIAELHKQRLDGYNLDWEVASKDDSDTQNFITFLQEFGDAIRKARPGATITSDVAGSLAIADCQCVHCDYLNMSCSNYTEAHVDSVVTMGTYTHNTSDFCTSVKAATKTALAPIYTPGLSISTPDDVIADFFRCADVVDRVFLWALDGSISSLTQAWNTSLNAWASQQ